MIYLIRTAMLDPSEKDLTKAQPISVLKIGYTPDLKELKSDSLGRPVELIAVLPECDERNLELILKYFHQFCIYGEEYFSYEDEILNFFHDKKSSSKKSSSLLDEYKEANVSYYTNRFLGFLAIEGGWF